MHERQSVPAWKLAAGPLAAAMVGALALLGGATPAIAITAAITAWCATWWILEPVDGAVTACSRRRRSPSPTAMS